NSIDLSGINLADFVSLRTVLVKIDGRDTVNRGTGWTPAGSETIDGQRYLVFTQGNATLKITDVAPATPPASPGTPGSPGSPGTPGSTGGSSTPGTRGMPAAPQARGIAASLVRTRGRRGKLRVRVSFADTGETKQEFPSPYQSPRFRGVSVSVKDGNADGIA